MIKKTTVFLDFSGETIAQNHVFVYANDFGSRILNLICSKELGADEHLAVTYYLGNNAVFSGQVYGLTAVIPNAVVSQAGEYKAYFAVFNDSGVKLTAFACVDITIGPCVVLPELDSDIEGESVYLSLLRDYNALSVKAQQLKDNLKDIADISLGVNLYDSRLSVFGKIDTQTGAIITNSEYILSSFIPATYGETLYATCEIEGSRVNAPCTWAAYNENKEYISSKENAYSIETNNTYIKYFRVCVNAQYAENLQISIGQHDYEKYNEVCEIKENSINSNHLMQNSVTDAKIANGAISQRHISQGLASLIASAVNERKTGSLIFSSCPLSENDDLTYRIYGLSKQGQNPSPTAPKYITDSINPTLRISGKNLLSGTRTAKTHNGVTFTPLANGGIKVEGTSVGGSEYELIDTPVQFPAGTYVLTCNIFGSGATYSQNGYAFSNDSVTSYPNGGVFSTLKIAVQDGVTANATLFPQLEIGQKSEFQAPTSISTASASQTLCGIKASEFEANTVKFGNDYYICDSVDRSSYVRRIKSLTLNGLDNGKEVTSLITLSNGKTAAIVSLNEKAKRLIAANGVICSHFDCGTDGDNYCFITDDGDFAMVYADGDLISVAEWNAWLNNRSVSIRYVLQSYTSTALQNTPVLKTHYPSISAMCSSGFAEISFKANTKKYIDETGGITS